MNQICLSLETDPYFNIAAEYQMLLDADNSVRFFVWQNRPAVICGRNQNLYGECDVEYLQKEHILPVRRFSGGGTVFQDLGNVNFTFLTREENADTEKYMKVIQRALSFFDVTCQFSGRNDLLCQGKKFSGHAYYTENGNHMYHGTIMVNVDMGTLDKVLKPSFIKLRSKGISSVRSRVVNLSQINHNITVESMKQALIRAFIEVYGESGSVHPVNRKNTKAPLFETIRTQQWIFGESPNYSISFEQKLSCGNVTICADVTDGIIRHIKIHTDSLTVFDFSACEKQLTGTAFQKSDVFEFIENHVTNCKKHAEAIK